MKYWGKRGRGWGGIKELECADTGDLSFCLHLAQHLLPLHRFIHTHTHTHIFCLLWRMSSGGHARRERDTFQGATDPTSTPAALAHLPPGFPKGPSLPVALSAYLHQSQHAGAGESPSHAHRESEKNPGLPTGRSCIHAG